MKASFLNFDVKYVLNMLSCTCTVSILYVYYTYYSVCSVMLLKYSIVNLKMRIRSPKESLGEDVV